MNAYPKEKLKSVLSVALCCLVLAAALYGLYKMISVVSWNARNKDYRQALAASMEYAESHNCLSVAIDGEEPVKIRYDRVFDLHKYLVITPQTLPARRSGTDGAHAQIDCGDGSTLELWDIGERLMRLEYRTPAGKRYRYTLQYHTAYDGWNGFLRIVSGEYRPG